MNASLQLFQNGKIHAVCIKSDEKVLPAGPGLRDPTAGTCGLTAGVTVPLQEECPGVTVPLQEECPGVTMPSGRMPRGDGAPSGRLPPVAIGISCFC